MTLSKRMTEFFNWHDVLIKEYLKSELDFYLIGFYNSFMALEHRDWYREKKPDWDNIKFPKKSQSGSRFLTPLIFIFAFVLTIAVWYYFDVFYKPVHFVPLRSIPQDQSVPLSFSPDKFQSLPPPEVKQESLVVKESPVVRSIPAGYQGYMEVNGVRKEIYSKAVVSETYRYRSVSNVKFIPAKVNGVEFDMMIDTGASQVSLDSNAIKKLGITQFTDKKIHSTAGGDVWAYYFPCTIALGSFEVSGIQCSYNPENRGGNLLGGSFLKNFNYSFNESEITITLTLR